MANNKIDYSLPYEVALANFRKKHGNNVPFMSKDQYELMQARGKLIPVEKIIEEANNKMAANEGKSDWWTQPGEAEKIVSDITGIENPTKEEVMDAANKIAERGFTPDQQGIQSKGNLGDNNITNPDALDTSEVTKLHNELKSMAQTEENMEPGTWSNTPEQVEEAKNNAGITKTVPGSTSAGDGNNSDDGDSDDDGGGSEPDKNYKKSMMSIWDAYRAGLIDKETAGYFTIDAIATLAKNLGRSIGNVGAQFSGGTIDNGHDESKWGQRQKAVMNEEIQKELEGLGSKASRQAESESLDNQAKRIRNAYTPKMLEQQIEMFKKELEKAEIDLNMAHSKEDLIKFIKSDPDYANSPFKMGMVAYLAQNGVGGAVNNASSTLLDAMNWAITLVK